jgi:hypothetical protein
VNPEPDNRQSVPEQDNNNTEPDYRVPVAYRPHPQVYPSQPEQDVEPSPLAAEPSPSVASEVPPVVVPKTNPAVIILQWLSYAFWGWLILVVMYLIGITTTFALTSDTYVMPEPVAYGVAAALILLPIAFICDQVYSRREPEHKHGAAMVILVIHAVLFALFGIAALIVVAFAGVNMLITTGDHTNSIVTAVTAGAGFVLYVITLLRTVRPFIFKVYRLVFRLLMIVLVLGVSAWGILGPVAEAARTKDDQAVRSAMIEADSGIRSYVSSEGKLPEDLTKIDDSYNSATVQDLVSRGLISYTVHDQPANAPEDDTMDGLSTVYYELCATYKYDQKKDSYSSFEYGSAADMNGYRDVYTGKDAHAGKNCYKLKASTYIPAAATNETDVTIETLRS